MIDSMRLIGVTGTNGKTTVTQWIAQLYGQLNKRCCIVGTLGYGDLGALSPGPNTTPGAHVLAQLLPRWAAEGAYACAMEVSSIGLHQNRVEGLAFDVAVFTNLSRDHLEYHGTMEEYAAMKKRLFAMPGLRCAVLNLDDALGREIAQTLAGKVRTIGYSLEGRVGADEMLHAQEIVEHGAGVAFRLADTRIEAPVLGRFNVANLLATIGALMALDEPLSLLAAGCARLVAPRGRLEMLGGKGEPLVVIDYAHSPDALEKVLLTLRPTAHSRGGKLVCVFGCGGERDPGKRPIMGAIAERLADRVIVTSDNPRGEDPQAIIAAILAGMEKPAASEVDRAAAITRAIQEAEAQDVILLAGKGHEDYQEICGRRLPFSDARLAQSALAARQASAPTLAAADRRKSC
ncbi:MAG: UDP-N-acetylmuramoyl-L-alanyl-D-glutamate--2,6-diaminopimelate ligase [Rhodocyclaceae bacterium]|nr:UDP-N-acetylmuramoyl-L-alanyl-D-glutamate--2,6-diaminopimelate ligase [Rhodocyclaceae bacterium]